MNESLLIYGKDVCNALFFICAVIVCVIPFSLTPKTSEALGFTKKYKRFAAILFLVAVFLMVFLPGNANWNHWIDLVRKP